MRRLDLAWPTLYIQSRLRTVAYDVFFLNLNIPVKITTVFNYITMNKIAHIQRINAQELKSGIICLDERSASWHVKYLSSAWVYVGGLSDRLSEGDVVCIMSEFGEVEDINLVRDDDTGKSRGFSFLKYEDARSCVLAVDNLTGAKVLGRTLCCDHVEEYRLPKTLREKAQKGDDDDNDTKWEVGHAYKDKKLASEFDLNVGQDLFTAALSSSLNVSEEKQYDLIPDDGDIYFYDKKSDRKLSKEEKRARKVERHLKKEQKKTKKESKKSRKEHSRKRRNDSDSVDARKPMVEHSDSDTRRRKIYTNNSNDDGIPQTRNEGANSGRKYR